MKKIKEFIKNNWWYLISPATVCLVLFTVYFIKGVFPFGENNIAYFDMAQGTVPFYNYTHDVLHFKTDLFLNWNSGLAGSMADVIGHFVVFPINLFFYFVPRNMILESMSFFLALYLCLISFSMTFCSYFKGKNKILAIASGIIYACSGYVIQYYSNIYFLNTVLVLPFLIWSLEKLIKENVKKYFLIFLPLLLLSQLQLVFSVGIYLIVKSFIEIYKLEKNKRAESFGRLFVCTIIGFATSSVVLIPEVIQTLASSRADYNESHSYLDILNTVICDYQPQKNFMLYGAEFVIPLIILLIVSKKFSKKYIGNIILIVLFSMPIVFENINMLLHTGTYVMFPMRFAFILTFEALMLLNESFENIELPYDKIKEYLPLVAFPLAVFYCIVLYSFTKYFTGFGIRDTQLYYSYWLILLLASVVYLFALGNKKRTSAIFCLLIAFIECSLGLYGFVAPEYESNPECYDFFINESVEIKDEINDFDILFDKIKDNNFYLNSDYSFITGKTSVSGWMNGIGSHVLEGLHNMGYDECYFRALDCGGTALTDSILGYKYSVFDSDSFSDSINDTLYSKIDGNEYVYKYNYPVEFGFVGDELFNNNLYRQFGYQECFSYAYMPDNKLFEIYSPEQIKNEILEREEGGFVYRCSVTPSSDSVLYIYGPAYCDESYSIKINNKNIYAPFLYLLDNTSFPNYYRNGFLECGTYKSSDEVVIDIYSDYDTEPNLQIGFMNIDEFEKIINKMNSDVKINSRYVYKRRAMVNMTSSKDGYYIVPIGYSDNWKVKINGEKTETYEAFDDMLLAVKVKEGINSIEFYYSQKGLLLGAIFTIVGIALSVFVCLYRKKMPEVKFINNILYILFYVITSASVILIWILPIVFQIVNMIRNGIGYGYIWFYY